MFFLLPWCTAMFTMKKDQALSKIDSSDGLAGRQRRRAKGGRRTETKAVLGRLAVRRQAGMAGWRGAVIGIARGQINNTTQDHFPTSNVQLKTSILLFTLCKYYCCPVNLIPTRQQRYFL